MGQHASCTDCDFSFIGGHSHHSGASYCICRSCNSLFSCPTESVWGPKVGEEIELIQTEDEKDGSFSQNLSTGVTFTAERGESYMVGETESCFINYPLETVACPNCFEKSLSLTFENGDDCPNCQTGTLVTSSVIY